jgi:uncharacterized membrane protein YphA (DoxX/SURF4 family)/peroxiredoxin
MESAVLGIRFLLAATFAVAGVAKLLDLDGSRNAMRGFGVSERAANPLGVIVPVAELLVAVALVLQPTARWGAVGALLLLLAFSAGIGNALRQGIKPDCHCFGQLHSAPAGRQTLGRNLALAAVAAFAVIEGPGPSVTDWVAARTPAELVAVGIGVLALALGGLCYRLWDELRKLEKRHADALSSLDKVPLGLPVGTPAPDFDLAATRGGGSSLSELHADGVPVMLLFVDPACTSCNSLMPDLGRWQTALADRLRIAVIGSGDKEEEQRLSEKHGVRILLDEDSELFETYRLRETPSAVLVGSDGRIATEPVNTGFQIEGMIRMALRNRGAARREIANPA